MKNDSEGNGQGEASVFSLDCEQSLFFFRFSKGSARAREH